ncbi:MAG: YbbR-like domain-containing protein [Mucilaginibacter polytrichastri]|nr:YbbR-like domain-containing protein [Mucilaginibacter polytrichastri]
MSKLTTTERRRLTVFFLCLVTAMLAWLFLTLSNRYTFPVEAQVSFTNLPENKAFHPLQSDTVDVTMEGTGWQMLFARATLTSRVISVDVKSLEKRNFVVISPQLRRINQSQESTEQIVSVSPDTLYFDFSSRSVKKIPVDLEQKITYDKQFFASGDIEVRPKYVTVSGPAENIAKISSWKTDSMIVDKVNSNINMRLSLLPLKEGNMNIYPKTVQVYVPVDEFTEKVVEVPVRLINNKSYYNVRLYPDKVKVKFTVALNKFTDADRSLFEATADLDNWKQNGMHQLPVKLSQKKLFGKVLSVEPAQLDFVIQK